MCFYFTLLSLENCCSKKMMKWIYNCPIYIQKKLSYLLWTGQCFFFPHFLRAMILCVFSLYIFGCVWFWFRFCFLFFYFLFLKSIFFFIQIPKYQYKRINFLFQFKRINFSEKNIHLMIWVCVSLRVAIKKITKRKKSNPKNFVRIRIFFLLLNISSSYRVFFGFWWCDFFLFSMIVLID